MTTERERFEAWAQDGKMMGGVERAFAWAAWQAALAQPAQPVLHKFDPASEERAKLALYAIGEAMGYGWAQAELGGEWERRHDCAPRGRMGVSVKDNAAPQPAPAQEPGTRPDGTKMDGTRPSDYPPGWDSDNEGPNGKAPQPARAAPTPSELSDAERPKRDAWVGGNSYEASMLRNLLARIHGDGGHYLEAHGLEKALDDAEQLVAGWRATVAEDAARYRWLRDENNAEVLIRDGPAETDWWRNSGTALDAAIDAARGKP